MLGLSSQHEEYIIDYLRFSKSKRSQCLDAIQASFTDLADSRLVETTLTSASTFNTVYIAGNFCYQALKKRIFIFVVCPEHVIIVAYYLDFV